MDKDGYPTDEELQEIRQWSKNRIVDYDVLGLLDYIRDRWRYADSGYFKLVGKRVLRLELHTAGWSGNESIIDALQENVFWFMWWQKSTRGGHYYFRIDLKKDR